MMWIFIIIFLNRYCSAGDGSDFIVLAILTARLGNFIKLLGDWAQKVSNGKPAISSTGGGGMVDGSHSLVGFCLRVEWTSI